MYGLPRSFIFNTWWNSIPYWIVQIPEVVYVDEPLLDRRDLPTDPQIPVGGPDVQSSLPDAGIELSNLVISERPTDISSTITPRSTVALTDAEWYARMFPGQVLMTNTPTPLLTTTEAPVADFFDDLGDLAIDYAKSELGLNPPPDPGPSIVYTNPNTGDSMPGNVPYQAPGACDTGPSPVWKKVCGVYKWVTPKRRRRRALLTETDYNALLRIEGLKVNKNMSIAIAKALTR